MEKNFYKWLEEPNEVVGFLFWKISYIWQNKINNALKVVNLTHGQFALLSGLAWLEKDGEKISQVKLAKFTQTNTMVASKTLRLLEKRNLIQRKEDEKDTRVKYVSLTENGIKTMEKASKIIEDFNMDFFNVLGVEKDQFKENLLDILYSNID